MAALMESVKGDEQSEAPDFTIPTVTLNVEEDSNEIRYCYFVNARRFGKMF